MCAKILIYQIGRLDQNLLQPIKFRIENQEIEAPLSGIALKNFFKSKNLPTHLILLFPVSLYFNKKILEWNLPEKFKQTLQNIFQKEEIKAEFLNNPQKFLSLHPHKKYSEGLVPLHSIGNYEKTEFTASFDDLVLTIFFDLLERYLKNPDYETIYLDISSGLNIYITAMLEAGRLFYTFYKLSEWIDPKLKVFISFSEPIIGSPKRIFKIFKDNPINVKAFFSPPEVIKSKNDDSLACGLTENKKELRLLNKFLHEIFSRAYVFISALIYNLPLVLYQFPTHREEEIFEAVQKIIELGKTKLEKNYLSSPCLDRPLFQKAIFLLGLYIGVVKTLKEYKIFEKREVPLREIKEKFCDNFPTIYDIFGLSSNKDYLSHEIDNNFIKKNKIFKKEWKLLSFYFEKEKTQKGRKIKFRNFFAHCGFEQNILQVRKEDDEIYLTYHKEELSKIEDLIFEKAGYKKN